MLGILFRTSDSIKANSVMPLSKASAACSSPVTASSSVAATIISKAVIEDQVCLCVPGDGSNSTSW
jgi:hypothetical protein